MEKDHHWQEMEELPHGWMTRLSNKTKDLRGNFARFYRAPEGTIFRSRKCMYTYLEERGRLVEIEKLKNMRLQRKRTFSQVNTGINYVTFIIGPPSRPVSFLNRWMVHWTGAHQGAPVVGIHRPAVPEPKR